MTSTASVASMTSIASFHQKTSWVDIFINHDTKMTYPGFLMWDGSLKIHYFVDFWHFFYWRLWRPRIIKKIKTDELGINAPNLWTCRIQKTCKNQYLYAHQSSITYHSLLWDTLYYSYLCSIVAYNTIYYILRCCIQAEYRYCKLRMYYVPKVLARSYIQHPGCK